MSLFRTKSIDALIAASEDPEKKLRRSLGPWSLTALGIGAVIGSGIFTLTGTAAAGKVIPIKSILNATVLDLILSGSAAHSQLGRPGAGPAITLSFLLVAVACLFAGLCYAELASMIPIAGSAYTYAYAILGEIVAWIIGWDLILEYAVSNMSVAVGFSAYLQDLFDNVFGFHLPARWAFPPFPAPGGPAGWFNIPALLITLLVTWVLVRGVRESARANTVMVAIKIAAILIFCLGAARSINPANWHPFAPHGFPGILTGASIVFFTYIGFDSVSTAAEECKRPQRDLPFGIIATLIVCTILYASVSLVLTGIANYQTLGTDSPVADALKALGFNNLRMIVTAGALMGMLSSLLVYQYGQARIWFAMSRDRLLPAMFSAVHKRFQTPHISTWIAGFVVGIPAGIWDIDTFAELSNIGTLFAFVLVSVGVIVLRRKQPERPRSFKVPLVPLFPMISIVCCVVLMAGLPLLTWIRFLLWLIIGLDIYFPFGRRHSLLNTPVQGHLLPNVYLVTRAICGGILIFVVRFLAGTGALATGWALAITVYASFATFYMCYQMWSAISDAQTGVSPIAAVAGLFVPIFGLFWLFRVFPGFVSAFNSYVQRHNPGVPRLQMKWFMAFAIFTVVACIPTFSSFGFLLAIPALASNIIMVAVASRTINALVQNRLSGAGLE